MADARLITPTPLNGPVSGLAALLATKMPIPENASPRLILEREVEWLIGILDQLDPDPDLEETGDLEPSLGPDYQGCTDLEADASDTEPSLGSFDRMLDQSNWSRTTPAAAIAGEDAELDRSGYEDGGDTEPNDDEDDDGDGHTAVRP